MTQIVRNHFGVDAFVFLFRPKKKCIALSSNVMIDDRMSPIHPKSLELTFKIKQFNIAFLNYKLNRK